MWQWFGYKNLLDNDFTLLILIIKVSKNNVIRTNYIKEIDNKLEYNKCRLRGDRNKTVNHIINRCKKLAQK